MRNNSLLICLYTLVMGAFGSFLRWIQCLNAFEEDTGLYVADSPLGWLFVAFSALFAVGLFIWCRYIKRVADTPENPPRLYKKGKLVAVGGYFVGFVMLVGAAATILKAEESAFPVLVSILGVTAAFAAVSLPAATQNGRWETLMSLRGLCSVIPVLFSCFWLIVSYKLNANDPVVWHFAVEVVAICGVMVVFYMIAGYAVDRVKPVSVIGACCAGVYLCAVALPDERPIGIELLLGASALFFLLVAFVQIFEITHKPGEPGGEKR